MGRVRMLLLLAIGVALVCAAPAAATHVQCGDTIVVDTTLDSDLSCPENGLAVGAAGVTLDLDGHVIQGAEEEETSGVAILGGPELQGAEVRGGRIRGFPIGVYVDGVPDVVVHDMVLAHNALGVHCGYAPGCSVLDSVLRNNGGGIRMTATDDDSTQVSFIDDNTVRDNGLGIKLTDNPTAVTDNVIRRNATGGLKIDYLGSVEVADNVIADNGGNGLEAYFGAIVTVWDNQIVRNVANGVLVYGGFDVNTQADVRYNHISRNGGDGVQVAEQGVYATVKRNRTDRNGDDGVEVGYTVAPVCCFQVVVTANEAFHNTDLGIQAVTGTTDGGGNRAKRNGNPAQCIGVACSR